MRFRKEVIITYFFMFVLIGIAIGGLYFINIKFTGFAVFTPGPGGDQTTLTLQEADLDNLGDSYVSGAGGEVNNNFGTNEDLKIEDIARMYLKFNLSFIPSNQNIDNAIVCLYVSTKKVQLINVNHVYSSWDELTLTWNNQPCGVGLDNSSACNLTSESSVQADETTEFTWLCWNATEMVGKEYNSGNKNVSMIFHTGEAGPNNFYSKEYTTDISLRPYLNITYSSDDTTAPNISIINPQNTTYDNSTILINISASDENLDSIWWYNGSDNITYTGETYYVFPEGSNTIITYANDSSGNENTTSITFTVNLNTAPSVTIIEPQNQLYISNESLALNFSVFDSDGNLDSCWYNLDSVENITLIGCANITFNTFQGSHVIIIYANDSNGLEASDNVSFDVDSTGVSVSVVEPTGTKSSRTGIPIGFTTIGDNLTCWYNVKTSIGGGVIENTTLENCLNSSFDVSNDGDYVLNLYVNNTFGSSDSDSSSFVVDTSSGDPVVVSSGGGGGGSHTTIITRNATTALTVSEIQNLIANLKDTEKISWSVKNTGMNFLNDCKLKGEGGYASWIFSNEIKDLSAGEEYEFVFDLNIPETTEAGKYVLTVSLTCQEISKLSDFVVEIIEEKLSFDLIKVERIKKDQVKVIYSLEELSGLEQDVELQFFLFGFDNEKVAEVKESKIISANSKQEFEILIPVDSLLEGEMNLLINLNSEAYSTFVQEDIVLGAPIGGFVIFGKLGTPDNLLSIIFSILFLVFSFFMIKKIVKHKKKKK